MSRRRFGVRLLSTPKYYLFSEEEAKKIYFNLSEYIKRKYENTDYDYSILVGLSNVDGKSVLRKIKSCEVGRPKYIFIPKGKELKKVNYHFHIMVCGSPLGTIATDIADYLQKILNIKIMNCEFDKEVYNTNNFNRFYHRAYKNELEMLLSGLLRKRENKKERIPRCCLVNMNVNNKNTKHTKEDYFEIIDYIEKQSMLTRVIESKDFKVAYFDYAKNLNLLAKKSSNKWNYHHKNKGLE